MQYIEMITKYNDYNKTQTRKRFYIVNRERLTDEYIECCTEYNARYSYEYDFYKKIEFDGGLNFIAVRKPYYRVVTDLQTLELDCYDTVYKVDKVHYLNSDEVTANELKSGDLIKLNEYDEPLEVYSVTEY